MFASGIKKTTEVGKEALDLASEKTKSVSDKIK